MEIYKINLSYTKNWLIVLNTMLLAKNVSLAANNFLWPLNYLVLYLLLRHLWPLRPITALHRLLNFFLSFASELSTPSIIGVTWTRFLHISLGAFLKTILPLSVVFDFTSANFTNSRWRVVMFIVAAIVLSRRN